MVLPESRRPSSAKILEKATAGAEKWFNHKERKEKFFEFFEFFVVKVF